MPTSISKQTDQIEHEKKKKLEYHLHHKHQNKYMEYTARSSFGILLSAHDATHIVFCE